MYYYSILLVGVGERVEYAWMMLLVLDFDPVLEPRGKSWSAVEVDENVKELPVEVEKRKVVPLKDWNLSTLHVTR